MAPALVSFITAIAGNALGGGLANATVPVNSTALAEQQNAAEKQKNKALYIAAAAVAVLIIIVLIIAIKKQPYGSR